MNGNILKFVIRKKFEHVEVIVTRRIKPRTPKLNASLEQLRKTWWKGWLWTNGQVCDMQVIFWSFESDKPCRLWWACKLIMQLHAWHGPPELMPRAELGGDRANYMSCRQTAAESHETVGAGGVGEGGFGG